MHLLRVEEGGALYDSDEAVDLGQPPGDIVILTSADTEVSLLSAAVAAFQCDGNEVRTDAPRLRVANYLSLSHPFSVDRYIANTVAGARLVVVRLLGGSAYWSYGVQQLRAQAVSGGVPVVFLPGDARPDPELDYLSSFDTEVCRSLSAYLDAGGKDNALAFLHAISDLLDGTAMAAPPRPLLRAGIYWPGRDMPDLASLSGDWIAGAPVAAIIFYRALLQADDLAPVDAMITACRDAGLNPLPLFSASLKDGDAAPIIAALLAEAQADVILNMTSFAVSDPAAAGDTMPGVASVGPFGAVDAPVLQLVLAASRVEDWTGSTAGLTARDLAMNVALPELDGRLLTRAVGFKRPPRRDPLTHAMTTGYEAVPDRAAYVATLAAGWARLRRTDAARARVALVMANYPNRDGRLANGVGLDTPASACAAMTAMADAGYQLGALPQDSAALIADLRAGPTNEGWQGRVCDAAMPLQSYRAVFGRLPDALREAVIARWGDPADDPMCDGEAIRLPLRRYGHVLVAVQPARGYNIDPKA
ncbi:MAG: cobaltochelatase subunit CobN, partial [Pseudomonadota bacterium]|nr:cobaltochelatase subunit CobN [Pseudomonadota bacterium]